MVRQLYSAAREFVPAIADRAIPGKACIECRFPEGCYTQLSVQILIRVQLIWVNKNHVNKWLYGAQKMLSHWDFERFLRGCCVQLYTTCLEFPVEAFVLRETGPIQGHNLGSRQTNMKNLYLAVSVAAAVLLVANANAAESGTTSVSCASVSGQRQHCAANTSAGILMARSTGDSACLLGKSWGYDDGGVWVLDGCSAEFFVAASPGAAPTAARSSPTGLAESAPPAPSGVQAQPSAGTPAPAVVSLALADKATAGSDTSAQPATTAASEPEPYLEGGESWGYFDPGKGFLVGKSEVGEASLSAYTLVRYLNQMDDNKEFTDHLGEVRPVDGRNDIYSHRAIVWLQGWVGVPKLRYAIAWWTVTATDQDALFGNIGYTFDESFNLFAGIFGNPGSRSMQGSHPYWLGNDRVMADEFFRPFFTQGMWASGKVSPGLWYSVSMGNTSSTLGNTASQLDRSFTYGGSVWWMPTTGEFGPRGGYGDWEYHEKLATRFGMSAVYSPEERYTDTDQNPGNTALRLADSLNVFETGSLAPGVTVTDVDYRVLSIDAGMKYHGIFLQAEFYQRWLDGFKADGYVPVDEIKDNGFYIQAAFYPMPKVLELYSATSQIFGDSSAGFGDSSEYLVGMNWYPFNSRNYRLNLQYGYVDKSPVSSNFGYYVGGQKGNTLAAAFSIFF